MRPKIYHLTHIDNLSAIVREGSLMSDAAMIRRGGPTQPIGMSGIKRRRVEELGVPCHPDTKVGDYVPFYFCARSVMLYVISCCNHPELAYKGGQGPIIHLEADLKRVIRWADSEGRLWAFSLSNAGARYTEFRAEIDELGQLDWEAIAARDFREAKVKEGKQAEFLLYGGFPFDLVERIGVHSDPIREAAAETVRDSRYRPVVEVRRDWYF